MVTATNQMTTINNRHVPTTRNDHARLRQCQLQRQQLRRRQCNYIYDASHDLHDGKDSDIIYDDSYDDSYDDNDKSYCYRYDDNCDDDCSNRQVPTCIRWRNG